MDARGGNSLLSKQYSGYQARLYPNGGEAYRHGLSSDGLQDRHVQDSRLKRASERGLRDRFDIRELHDVVLRGGSVSLAVLEKMIDDYISEH